MPSSRTCRSSQDFRRPEGSCKSSDDKSSSPVPSLRPDQYMTEVFAALDDIHFDVQFIRLRDPDKQSQSIDQQKVSQHTTWIGNTIYIDSAASGETLDQNLSVPSSSTSELKEKSRDIYTDDNDNSFVAMSRHMNLQRKVRTWLLQLPDLLPTSEPSCKEETKLHYEGIPMLESEYSGDPWLLGEAPSLRNAPTEFEKTDGMYKDIHGNENLEHNAPVNHEGILDSYHSALLHIHSISTPIDHARSSLRPSMRRRYPRGFEKEADVANFLTSKGREN
ncbi:hypothetical protein NW762_009033 [Fusarium torreyae]|uniref:Uncharacterized protein n=1 Tax=Fusarium torreyae TaxID=1237075 RepID=A0A9W8VD31_9HYPO|nr:hypothetical protein NW762_009033 [Fusarium torreyae]